MLILSRKLRQQIRIADDIVITVLQVKGSTVRLGIEAPCDVKILRGELAAHATTRTVEPAPPATTDACSRQSEVVQGQPFGDAGGEGDGDFAETFEQSLEDGPGQPWESGRFRTSEDRAARTAPLRRFMSAC